MLRCGYGQVVTMVAFYSIDLILNTSESYTFYSNRMLKKNENKHGPFFEWKRTLSNKCNQKLEIENTHSRH